MSESVMSQVKGATTPSDLLEIDLSTSKELARAMALGYILGVLSEEDTKQEFAYIPENVIDEVFSVKFEDAIDFLVDLYPTADMYMGIGIDDLNKYIGDVTKLTELTTQKKLLSTLSTSLDEGLGFDGWYDKFVDSDAKGVKSYCETVYRQNVNSAYAKGTYDQHQLNKDFKPYLMYFAIDDSRISDICEDLDGIVLEVDNPFWNEWTPPNHFNCRSTVVSLSLDDLEEWGIIPSNIPDMSEHDLNDGNLRGLPWENLEQAMDEREGEVNDIIDSIK